MALRDTRVADRDGCLADSGNRKRQSCRCSRTDIRCRAWWIHTQQHTAGETLEDAAETEGRETCAPRAV